MDVFFIRRLGVKNNIDLAIKDAAALRKEIDYINLSDDEWKDFIRDWPNRADISGGMVVYNGVMVKRKPGIGTELRK